MDDIFTHIAKAYDKMSRTQKKLADYILGNQTSVSFMTVGEMAKNAQVSEASVIRLANFLGFNGYSAMQKILRQYAQTQMDIQKRLTLSYSAYEEKEQGVHQIFNEESKNLAATIKGMDMGMFFKIVEVLGKARRIFIVCARSTAGLGLFLQYYLKFSNPEVYLIEDFQNNEDFIGRVEATDAVFAISFSRYTKRTLQLVEYISRRECSIISLTDAMTSPLIRYTDYYLLVQTSLSTYIDSFTAAQAVIDALLIELGRRKNSQMEARLAELEKIWDELDVFVK